MKNISFNMTKWYICIPNFFCYAKWVSCKLKFVYKYLTLYASKKCEKN